MECPSCEQPTRVLESRRAEHGAALRRRRECTSCGHRFTTFERRARPPLTVRKRDGASQRFDPTKLRAALLRSTHKRQVSADDVEALVDQVAVAIEAAGGELGAEQVGELCLAGLAELDRGRLSAVPRNAAVAEAGVCGFAAGRFRPGPRARVQSYPLKRAERRRKARR